MAFTLGGYIVENLRKCSDEHEVWVSHAIMVVPTMHSCQAPDTFMPVFFSLQTLIVATYSCVHPVH